MNFQREEKWECRARTQIYPLHVVEKQIKQKRRKKKKDMEKVQSFGFTKLITGDIRSCEHLLSNATIAASYILGFLAVVFLSNIARALLRSYQQPRMVAETLVGMLAGNLILAQDSEKGRIQKTLNDIIEFGMIFQMLVLGLKMDARVFFQRPTQEAIVAYSGMLSTFILAYFLTPFFHYSELPSHIFTFSLSITLAGTASPLLSRLITDHKIDKSDMGRLLLAAGMHSDLVSTLLISIGFVILSADGSLNMRDYKGILRITSSLIIQVLLTATLSPILMSWVNYENPPGKALKGSHMVISVAFVAISCCCSVLRGGYCPMMSAFISGIALPRDGRMSKMMIGKLNYFLKCIFYPIFFVWVGSRVDLRMFNPSNPWTWTRMIFIFVVSTMGKVVGTFLSGRVLGFSLSESVALGLLLNVKGHFHIFLTLFSFNNQNEIIMTTSTRIGLMFAIFSTVIYAPTVGSYIIRSSKKRSPNQLMTVQGLDSESELRILLCIHGPVHLPAAINFIEISRGRDDPRIMVYVTDMIELTEQLKSTLVKREGKDVVTVTDRAVVEMRHQITTAIKTYEEQNESVITLRRILALSPFPVMHQDICSFAGDLHVSLIVLPLHKYQAAGKNTGADSKFRGVNKRVLQNAPCSVGILVDRGFGVSTKKISRTSLFLHAAVIFIGGKDDREALAYGSQVCQHPGVKLTVLRFLLDAGASSRCSRPGTSRANLSELEEEMQLDDEFFAGFYERHVGGQVSYMEKYLANSGETISALQSFDGQYEFLIVGRGGRVNTALTEGMDDWEQCPELGPVGDFLSGSAFETSTTSILIIQQHRPKEELAGL